MSGTPLLAIEHVHAHYGAVHALDDVSVHVRAGGIVAVIGANGAGKTTLLRTISRLVLPNAGTIHFGGDSLASKTPGQVAAMGIAHVPEGRRIFAGLTVLENLELGAYVNKRVDLRAELDQAYALFPLLRDRARQLGGVLSGGEQQMLAIGRALMARPALLMLDEPSLGLAPLVIRDVFRTIRRINAQGTTVLLVEQSANLALRLAEYAYVLDTGRIVLSGPTRDLLASEQVRRVYLGEEPAGEA